MTIHRLFKDTAFGPDEIERLVIANKQTLRALRLKDRNDPITQLVAEKIIEIGRTGIEDPAEISKLALEQLGPLRRTDTSRRPRRSALCLAPDDVAGNVRAIQPKDKVETLGDVEGVSNSSAAPEMDMFRMRQFFAPPANSIAPDINKVLRGLARLSKNL
jgi:hypothetical protein